MTRRRLCHRVLPRPSSWADPIAPDSPSTLLHSCHALSAVGATRVGHVAHVIHQRRLQNLPPLPSLEQTPRFCFALANNKCEACGRDERIEGHHIVYRPILESCTVDDVMALCDRCHGAFHKWLNSTRYTLSDFSRESTKGALRALLYPVATLATDHAPPRTPPVNTKMEKITPSELQRRLKNDSALIATAKSSKRADFLRFLRRHFRGNPMEYRLIPNALIVFGEIQKAKRKKPVDKTLYYRPDGTFRRL